MNDFYNWILFSFKYDRVYLILQLIFMIAGIYIVVLTLLVLVDKITQRQFTNSAMIVSGLMIAVALLLGVKSFLSIPITLLLEFAYLMLYRKVMKSVKEDERKGITSCLGRKRKEQEEKYLNSIKDKSK